MTEIITRPQADLLLNLVLAVGFVAGIAGALGAHRRKQSAVWGGLLWGGPLILVWLMWRIYNAITDRLGLNSVLNLLINAALFVIVGAACGLIWARMVPHGETEENTESAEHGTG